MEQLLSSFVLTSCVDKLTSFLIFKVPCKTIMQFKKYTLNQSRGATKITFELIIKQSTKFKLFISVFSIVTQVRFIAKLHILPSRVGLKIA